MLIIFYTHEKKKQPGGVEGGRMSPVFAVGGIEAVATDGTG